jgi:hypothetical protein
MHIPITLNYNLNSNNVKAGDMIGISVNETVTINGTTIFKPGASGVLYIAKTISSAPYYGRPGHLIITNGYVTDIDGNRHPITVSISQKGISKRKRAIILSATLILFPLGAFTEGTPAIVQGMKSINAFTSKNTVIDLANSLTLENNK